MNIYDELNKTNPHEEKIFFGSGKGIQRYDTVKYSRFEDISESMLEDFWKKQEVKLINDKSDYDNADSAIRRVFDLNIKRQSIMDTIQGRSLLSTIGRVLCNTEIEKALTILQQQEVNHSDTYTYILRNVYNNPSDIFDQIAVDKVITSHASKIKELYEDLYIKLAKWEADEYEKSTNSNEYKVKRILSKMGLYHFITEDELKESVYLAIIAWNIIEGIRFFVSFACTFKMADNKIFSGNGQELKLIARDELNHLNISQKLVKILKTNESEGFVEIAHQCKDKVRRLYAEAVQDEIEWAGYLFENGPLLGLNTIVLTRYIKHLANIRLRAIKEDIIYPSDECSDLPYMNKWLGGDRVQELLQEMDPTQYKIGMTIPLVDEDWENLKSIYMTV
jgi:ribonucleoside-diphosphate reductase beta chain